jgi:hypothetical protein
MIFWLTILYPQSSRRPLRLRDDFAQRSAEASRSVSMRRRST